MQARAIGRGRKLVAKRTLAEHLGELRQELQMFFGGVFRNQQDEYLPDRLSVGRIKGNGLARANERAQRAREASDPAVRDRDPLAEAGRTEFLARKQAFEHDRTGNLRLVFEELTDLLEQPLLARRFEVEQNVRFRKQLRDLVQEWVRGPKKQSGGRSGSDAARRQDGAGLYATSQASSGARPVRRFASPVSGRGDDRCVSPCA